MAKRQRSTEVQVGLLTAQINHLQGHFAEHKESPQPSWSAAHGSQRRELADYLKRKDVARYSALIERLVCVANSASFRKGPDGPFFDRRSNSFKTHVLLLSNDLHAEVRAASREASSAGAGRCISCADEKIGQSDAMPWIWRDL